MDPLLTANNYFVPITINYSNPLYNTSLLTSNPSVSDYCPTIDFIKGEIPDVYGDLTSSNSSNSSSPPEPSEPIKTDLRKVRRKGTNLYGRPYCPGRPLSMAERTRIIELHMGGMKVNAISKNLCISHGCVSKIISRYRSTGILTPASSPEQRRSRRIKKTESSPESTTMQDHYVHLDYPMPLPVTFIPSPPSELLQSSPNNHFVVHQPTYTTLHDHMTVIQEYPHSSL